MDTYKKVDLFIQRYNLIRPQDTIIVGLSGGPDSVFLLHYLHQRQDMWSIKPVAAHLDHGWRKESEKDLLFCKNLCQKLSVPFVSKKIENMSYPSTGSKEQDGRIARRTFFEEILHTYNGTAIALAHHKDDQEETFFIRLIRGASLTGLVGIRAHHGMYIHPLLCITKDEILNWLKTNNISYLTDPTNISEAHLRNRVRNILLPTIKKVDTRFSKTFEQTLARLTQTEQFLEQLTRETFENSAKKLLDPYPHWRIDREQFLDLHPAMQHRILVYWLSKERLPFPTSQGFFDEMIRFIKHNQKSNVHAIHPSWHLVKNKAWFYAKKM